MTDNEDITFTFKHNAEDIALSVTEARMLRNSLNVWFWSYDEHPTESATATAMEWCYSQSTESPI